MQKKTQKQKHIQTNTNTHKHIHTHSHTKTHNLKSTQIHTQNTLTETEQILMYTKRQKHSYKKQFMHRTK